MTAALAALLELPGFTSNQTSLNPAGPGAAHIEREFALIFWTTAIVYCIVLAVLVITVMRNRNRLDIVPDPQPTTPESDRRATRAVVAAIGVTFLLIVTMLIGSFRTSRALVAMNKQQGLTIQVYGHQWWWEVVYQNAEPDKIVTTANEIHVPVGVPVMIDGKSADVIHSFWAPNIQGKRDLV